MTPLLIILSLLGAALPSVGVFRVYRRARADERERKRVVAQREGKEHGTWDDFDAMFVGLHAPNSHLRIARWDVVLVTLGLACTAAASILGAVNQQ